MSPEKTGLNDKFSRNMVMVYTTNNPHSTLHRKKNRYFSIKQPIPCPAQAAWPPATTADGPGYPPAVEMSHLVS